MAKRRSPFTPEFEFEDATGQYRYRSNGRFVPRTTARKAIDGYIDNKAQEVKQLAEQLRRREISISSWQKAMEENIAKIHLANAAAAKGGTERMEQTDYGRVGGLVKYEYQQLREFAKQIEAGLPLDGRFLQRAQQYAQAGRHTYHAIDRREQNARGMAEERSLLHARDSCEGCLSAAAKGWTAVGTLPLPGERTCRRNCRCTLEYRGEATSQTSPQASTTRESWKRRSEDEKRRRQREGADEESEPDWSDPHVHQAYGGGEPNTNGPSLLSSRMLEHLRTHAQPGQKEFGVVIERKSADVLFTRKGLKTKVTYDTPLLDEVNDLAIIHTHDEDLAFSPKDWTGFLINENVSEDMVVTPDGIYHLRKTSDFKPPHFMGRRGVGDGQEDIETYFSRRERELQKDTDYVKQFTEPSQLAQAIAETINTELSQKYGVEFLRYTFEE